MATTVKGGTFGKEKRGTSPSNSSSFKKSPKPSSSSPTVTPSSSTNDTASSATSSKPVPNYLKPTMSSNRDFSRLPKKSTSLDPSADKPALNRRMSFDRPSPTSYTPKGTHIVPGALGIKPLRSSSFSHKPATSSVSSVRPASERPYARDSKVEPALSKSRTLNKKSSLSSGTSATKKGTNAPKSVTIESSHIDEEFVGIHECEVQSLPEISEMPDSNEELGDPTTIAYIGQKHAEINKQHEDESTSMNNLDHSAKQGSGLESATPYQKPGILKDNVDKGKSSINYNHVREQRPTLQTTTTPDQKPAEQGSILEKPEILKDKGKSINYDHVREQGPSLQTATPPDQNPETVKLDKEDEGSKAMKSDQVAKQGLSQENTTADDKPETVKDDEDKNSDQVAGQGVSLEKATADDKPETVKETVVDHPEEANANANASTKVVEETSYKGDNEARTVSTPGKKTEDLVVEKAKDEKVSTSSPSRKAASQNNTSSKKEKQEYNDVIEETASKLMVGNSGGKRKNKVLALAGAFETVISLEKNTKK